MADVFVDREVLDMGSFHEGLAHVADGRSARVKEGREVQVSVSA